MTPAQRQRLHFARYCEVPISARTTPRHWARARQAVGLALSLGKRCSDKALQAGLAGAVFIEACREADRHLVDASGNPAVRRSAS